MIIYADRRNLQKDKHHCNTPSIWALWQCGKTQSSLQCRRMKTHLEFAKKKKHLKKPQTVRNDIIWSDEPQFQASCLKESRHCSSHAEYIPKVKCAGSSLMLWSCFSVAGTEGVVSCQSRRKTQCTKYWDSLNENPIQSIQNLRRAEGLPSNRTMDLNTQQEWLIDNSVNVLEWPSHSLGLNPVKFFWRNLKMCVSPHPTWQSLRGEEVRRRIAYNCQMLMSKACRNKQKRLEAVKVLQLNI